MKYTREVWLEKRKRGLVRYLLVDGILIAGGPFAVLMQVLGYFIFPNDAQSFGEYFSSSITWVRFILHGTVFGLIVGFLNWKRSEAAFANAETTEQNED